MFMHKTLLLVDYINMDMYAEHPVYLKNPQDLTEKSAVIIKYIFFLISVWNIFHSEEYSVTHTWDMHVDLPKTLKYQISLKSIPFSGYFMCMVRQTQWTY